MELQQLRCVVAVAEERHFGNAADRLHLSQPAVSQQVRALERELRVPLFDRTTRSVGLTDAGAAFVPRAREVLEAVDRARGAVARTDARRARRLVIGTCTGLGDLLDRALARFAHRHPGTAVELVRRPEQDRLRAVRCGELDVAFRRVPVGGFPSRTPGELVLWTESLVAAVPVGLTALRRRTIELTELAALPVHLPARRANPTLFDAVVEAYVGLGLGPRIRESTDERDMLTMIGRGGASWTLFHPARARLLEPTAPEGMAFRRLTRPTVRVATSLVRGEDPGPLVDAFVDACRVGRRSARQH